MNPVPWSDQSQQHDGATASTAAHSPQLNSSSSSTRSAARVAPVQPTHDTRVMENGQAAYHMAFAASQPQLLQPQPAPSLLAATPPGYAPFGPIATPAVPAQHLRDPADLSLAELCQSRDLVVNRARVLGDQGGNREWIFRFLRTTRPPPATARDRRLNSRLHRNVARPQGLEALLMPYLLARFESDRLPTNEMTLKQFAPDMMPVTGTRPKDFLMIWSLWISWTKRDIHVPSVPLVAPLITYFVLDSVKVLDDRARLVQILDMYRQSVNDVIANLGGRNAHELMPDWDKTRWTEWSAMLQTGTRSLFDWRAIREVCGLGVSTPQMRT